MHPVRDAAGAGQGIGAARQQMAVDQARQDLVQGIVGGPYGGVGRVLLQQGELVRRVGAQEAPAPGARRPAPEGLHRVGGRTGCPEGRRIPQGSVLEPAQLADHVLRLLPEALLPRGGEGVGQGRQEMPGGMTPEKPRGLLPAAQRHGVFRGDAEGPAEIVEHPVRVQQAQIGQAALLVLMEDAVLSQPDAVPGRGGSLEGGDRANGGSALLRGGGPGQRSRGDVLHSGEAPAGVGQQPHPEFPGGLGGFVGRGEGQGQGGGVPLRPVEQMSLMVHELGAAALPIEDRTVFSLLRQIQI